MPLQICRIENIVGKNKDTAMRVKWFYRPEETCSGRRVCSSRHSIKSTPHWLSFGVHGGLLELQAFHGCQEVMASDHIETHLQPIASIVSKCNIFTLEQYMVSYICFSKFKRTQHLIDQMRCMVACQQTTWANSLQHLSCLFPYEC